MTGVKITTSNENETIFTIEDNIKVTLIAENFNKTGEMIVEYDEEIISEEEATKKVNTYFEKLLHSLEKRKKKTPILDEIKEQLKNK